MSDDSGDVNLANLNYTTLLPYDQSRRGANGGDSLTENLNLFYQSGDIAWILTSTALVALMVPGVGFFYSGLARRKSALSLLWLALMSMGVVGFQWFLWGYSLAFSHTATLFIGNLDNVGLRETLARPSVASDHVPDLLYAVYQSMFAMLTVALTVGAVAERGRLAPCAVFMFVWSTLIYDPIACWTWNPSGWSRVLGGLDFAGGTPVHVASGAAALAYSLMLGKRRGHGTHELNYRPHNVASIVLGTVFLWVGWFGFNAGSALAANLRAVNAALVTSLSAGMGGVTWCLIDYRLERKFSTVGFCSGVVAALVCITPGSGYVPPWSAIIFGVVGATVTNFGTKLKYLVHIDDSLDIFSIHCLGGITGNLLTGLFAVDYIARLDGTSEINGGFLNGNYVQLAVQLADSAAGLVYSFLGTCLILLLINFIPGLGIRASEEDEIMGIDDAEVGEFAYDYVELLRDVVHGVEDDGAGSSSAIPMLSTSLSPEEKHLYELDGERR